MKKTPGLAIAVHELEGFVNYNGQSRRWFLKVIIIVVILVIAAGIWYFIRYRSQETTRLTGSGRRTTPKELPRMANLPPPEPVPLPPTPSYGPNAPVIEQARKALREGIDPAGAVALSKTLPESPERPDAAFLLLEYAADEGNAEAALAVGRYYDPTYDGPSGTIQKNPETAYEWYQVALAGGQKDAKKLLDNLQKSVTKQATNGSKKAQALIKRWR
jgi:hypothetical protein